MKSCVALLCCTLAFGQLATTPEAEPVVDYYDALSDYFRQSPRAIALIAKKGVSAEEIPAVLLIARRSSVSPNQVIADRKGGKEFAAIAEANHIKPAVAGDFVSEANIIFLSEYHGQPAEQIRAQHTKGASFVQINQQYRRTGMKPKTEKGVSPNK